MTNHFSHFNLIKFSLHPWVELINPLLSQCRYLMALDLEKLCKEVVFWTFVKGNEVLMPNRDICDFIIFH